MKDAGDVIHEVANPDQLRIRRSIGRQRGWRVRRDHAETLCRMMNRAIGIRMSRCPTHLSSAKTGSTLGSRGQPLAVRREKAGRRNDADCPRAGFKGYGLISTVVRYNDALRGIAGGAKPVFGSPISTVCVRNGSAGARIDVIQFPRSFGPNAVHGVSTSTVCRRKHATCSGLDFLTHCC